MIFQSHVPDFIDTDPPIPKQSFKDLDELLAHPWIKSWSEPSQTQKDFKYCWDPNEGGWSKACLMAEWIEDNKRVWFVLGYMDEIPSSLPQWHYNEVVPHRT